MNNYISDSRLKYLFESGGYEECVSTNAKEKGIYEHAESVHKAICNLLQVPSVEVFDPKELVSIMGGKISFLRTEPSFEGGILMDTVDDFDIIVPDHTTPVRDRFTIMHEIGHYVLHAPLLAEGTKYKAKKGGTGTVEQEANWFSAGVLMPTEKLRKLMDRYYEHFKEREKDFKKEPMRQHFAQIIADEFLVSLPAAYFRLLTFQKEEF